MRKTILSTLLSLAMLATLSFPTANAQDKQVFNHLSIGITTGLDGLGLELAAPLTPVLRVRAGYSLMPFLYRIPPKMLPETIEIGNSVRPLRGEAVIETFLNTDGGKLLLDVYPWMSTNFHFTVGAFINPKPALSVNADLSRVLRSDEYASYGVQIDPADYRTNITSDKQGHLYLDMKTYPVRPYIGVGFGSAVIPDRRVTVTFDLGVLIWGKPLLQSYDYSIDSAGSPVPITGELLRRNESTAKAANAIDVLGKVSIFPMFRVNVFFRVI